MLRLLVFFIIGVTLTFASVDPSNPNFNKIHQHTDIASRQDAEFELNFVGSDMVSEDVDEDEDDNDDDEDGARGFLHGRKKVMRRVPSPFSASSTPPSSSSSSLSTAFVSSPSILTPPKKARKAFALTIPRGGAVSSGNEFAAKLLVSALVTLVFEGSCGHICEFLKILRMTTGESYGTLVRKITAEKGVSGFWDGFVPWGVFQSIGKGGAFGIAHALILPIMLKLYTDGCVSEQLAKVMAGGLAGGVQGYVLSPLLLLKTRVMTDPVFREKMSTLQTILASFSVGARVVTREGGLALMKGANVFALKRVFDWSTRYYFAEVFEQVAMGMVEGDSLSTYEKMACSILGGSLSSVLTLPLDSMVAKIQDSKAAGVKMSPIQMVAKEYEDGGLGGLWNAYMKGWEMRTVHVGLTTVAMKTWSPLVYDMLFNKE